METDETKIEGQQESSSSEDNKTASSDSEVVKTQEDKGSVPYDRFKEVIDSRDEDREALKTLKEDMETLKQQQPKKEEEEPLDWREAENRAVDKAVSKIEEKNRNIADEKHQHDSAIEKGFEQIKGLGHEVTNDIKKAVLTKMIKDGSTDVFDTYLKVKESLVKTEKTDQTKKDGFIPSSQKGTDAGKPGIPYKKLRDMSLEEIAEGAGK